jgi:hypothetical protein
MGWADAMVTLLEAGLAAARGRDATVPALLTTAMERLDSSDMPLHAAAARFRLGQWTGGDEGTALIEGARARLASHRVRRPERILAVLAPGLEPR